MYLRLKRKRSITSNTKIRLKDVALITTTHAEKEKIEQIPIYHVTNKDKDYVIIDSFLIIKHLNRLYPDLEIQLVGVTESIIQIQNNSKNPPILLACLVWLVLFIGTAMTIINFHYDVSMQEVQQKLHYILTGEQEEFPLWIQIPYSIGLGVGMVLFLNQWFKKKLNEEPSPLEIEMFNYQKDIDDYIAYYDNVLNEEDRYF